MLASTAAKSPSSSNAVKCAGPAKWTYFYLYVVLDVFRRSRVVYRRDGGELLGTTRCIAARLTLSVPT
jgi:hypothetical protein